MLCLWECGLWRELWLLDTIASPFLPQFIALPLEGVVPWHPCTISESYVSAFLLTRWTTPPLNCVFPSPCWVRLAVPSRFSFLKLHGSITAQRVGKALFLVWLVVSVYMHLQYKNVHSLPPKKIIEYFSCATYEKYFLHSFCFTKHVTAIN